MTFWYFACFNWKECEVWWWYLSWLLGETRVCNRSTLVGDKCFQTPVHLLTFLHLWQFSAHNFVINHTIFTVFMQDFRNYQVKVYIKFYTDIHNCSVSCYPEIDSHLKPLNQCSLGHVIGVAFFDAISVAWSERAGQLAAGGVASVWRSRV